MTAIPMLQACARHQLTPDPIMWDFLKARYEEREFPGPNLIVKTYAFDHDEGGTMQPMLALKEA